jgi:nucleotide-binding universal stress UspA family protein
MILLAHDGSIYSDWVARYALLFAELEADRKLLVLHVPENKISQEVVNTKFLLLEEESLARGIDFSWEILPLVTSVHRSLRQALPQNRNALLICGTRIKPNKRAFLRGSVAEKLLRQHQCPMLAIRVVQPGLLGNPRELLLPLAGHAGGFDRVWPIFKRLAPRLRRVHLLRTLRVHTLRHPYLTVARETLLRTIGNQYLDKISASLDRYLEQRTFRLERQVLISSDWANDVLVQASRLKVQMILLGVSERRLAHRVLYGDGIETLLRNASCDVGVYRGP